MQDRQRSLLPLFYIGPALALLTVLSLLPNLYTVYLAFTNHSLFHFQEFSFVGLRNFERILFGPEMRTFGRVFSWTLIWAGLSVFFSIVVGLMLALPLNTEGLRGVKFYRTLFIVPWAIPAFISVLMWQGLLNSSDQGAINGVLLQLGGQKIPWLDDPWWSRFSVLLVNVWLGYPFMLTVCLGALQSIPKDLYEAAGMDGASPPKQFMSVTLPMLRPALVPVIVSSFAFNFNQFSTIYLLTAGGPPVAGSDAGATDILITTSYKLAFTQYQYGLACAYAVLIFLIVASISWVNFNASGAFDD
ncbi:ABC transporter permease subunit [bacterium]|nr:ABC transporter permease subunit [bacterium]